MMRTKTRGASAAVVGGEEDQPASAHQSACEAFMQSERSNY